MVQSSDRIDIQKLSLEFEMIFAAQHEAGHTIVGLLNFIKIDPVEIFRTAEGRGEGFTHYDIVGFTEDKGFIIKDNDVIHFLVKAEVVLNYAGSLAEKNLYRHICGADALPMVLKEGSFSDMDTSTGLIREYNLAPPGQKRYTYKQKLLRQTSQTIEIHWQDITLVAHALYDKHKLSFDDLKNLLTRKSPNKSFWKERFRVLGKIYDSRSHFKDRDLRHIFNLI